MITWLKNHMINKDRCGFSPFRTGPWDPFHDACKEHDRAYTQKKFNREYIDHLFYKNVKQTIDDAPWYAKPILIPWGYAYTTIVKLIGKAVWER